VFEYLYAGAYRLCIGEFPTMAEAMELQKKLMETDYPNASVVVFRNDVITFDPELLKEEATADVRPEAVVKQPADTVKTKTEVKTETKKVEPEKVVIPKTEPVKAVIPKTEEKKVVPVKETETAKKDEVVYRVQILSEPKAKGSYDLKVNNITYKTYEYFYVGSYRTCIGEFSTLAPARDLQNTARKAGFSQAFVVAFKNNVRSTDPELFK
jgi:outer membrane biosynthesis protein TonB